MRMGFVNHKSIAPLLIAVSLAAAPGCKSGWKMPSPSNMWPWNRQPSAETLAGTPARPAPESPQPNTHLPLSPASLPEHLSPHRPPVLPAVAQPVTWCSLASTPVTRPAYGSAAAANSYQVGPYGMTGQTAQTPTAQTPPANTGYPGSSQVPPNTYGGLAGLPSATMPQAQTPNTSNPYAPPAGAVAQSNTPPLPGASSRTRCPTLHRNWDRACLSFNPTCRFQVAQHLDKHQAFQWSAILRPSREHPRYHHLRMVCHRLHRRLNRVPQHQYSQPATNIAQVQQDDQETPTTLVRVVRPSQSTRAQPINPLNPPLLVQAAMATFICHPTPLMPVDNRWSAKRIG